MSQHQEQHPEEMPEYHTIQVFREADMILEPQPAPTTTFSSKSDANVALAPTTDFAMPTTTAVSQPSLDMIPYDHSEDGIGGDWAIDVEMDVVVPPPAERRGSDSTLYSFYFETPIVAQQQQQDDDDFTITSQETESFHNTEDLGLLQDSSSFWETGLAAPTTDVSALQRCTSPAHVSLTGEEQLQQQSQKQQPTMSGMC